MDNLTKVRDLVAAGWTKNSYWRDTKGIPCPRENAACMCLVGAAIVAVGASIDSPEVDAVLETLRPFLPKPYRNARIRHACLEFNDTHTQAEILALLDKAIKP